MRAAAPASELLTEESEEVQLRKAIVAVLLERRVQYACISQQKQYLSTSTDGRQVLLKAPCIFQVDHEYRYLKLAAQAPGNGPPECRAIDGLDVQRQVSLCISPGGPCCHLRVKEADKAPGVVTLAKLWPQAGPHVNLGEMQGPLTEVPKHNSIASRALRVEY